MRSFLRRRANLLIGIPLGIAIGLLVAYLVVAGSGRDTPTFSTGAATKSAPLTPGAGAPAPGERRR